MKGVVLVFVAIMSLFLAACGVQEDDMVEEFRESVMAEEAPKGQDGADSAESQEGTGAETEASEGDAAEVYLVEFEANTIEGEAYTSQNFGNSKLTMINVWATYCNPCLSEMPDLGELAASYEPSEFQMVGIISDVMEGASEEELTAAKELIAETEATTYPHLLLNESLYVNLVGGVSAVPTTFFVNQQGEMLGYLTGAQSKDVWESIINDLLTQIEGSKE